MNRLRYCKQCVMPDSKPLLAFDERGVCSACRAHERKHSRMQGIDWDGRKKELDELLCQARSRHAPFYDILVPVSGGKDSIFQVHVALQYKLRVLAVNVDYGIKTEIGQYNLDLIPAMGATLLTVRPEHRYHTRLIKIGFEDYGDPDLMSHGLLFSYPLWIACRMSVPVVLEGENSAFEYGGDRASREKVRLDREWFSRHVMTRGVTVDEVRARYGIPSEILKVYDFPEQDLRDNGVQAVFLSHFMPWDSERHLQIATEYGFRALPGPREGTFRSYVGIDEKINRIHQYMKVLKFGYGRATDHACEEIRNHRISRSEAVELVRRHDREALSDYYVGDFLELLKYRKEDFWAVLEQYRNRDIWQRRDGRWVLDDSALDGE